MESVSLRKPQLPGCTGSARIQRPGGKLRLEAEALANRYFSDVVAVEVEQTDLRMEV